MLSFGVIAAPINPGEAYKLYYHIESTKITSGTVKSRKASFPGLPKPIFIVGDDAVSLQWLDKYAEHLKKIDAVGFIVQLKDYEAYKVITDKYKLQLLPTNGDAFVKRFQIQHYPVLISSNLIEQ